MKKPKYNHIVKQPKQLYEVSVEDLWDEISHLKSYVSNLKDENKKQKIQLLKMEEAVRTRDQEIEHLMNPKNNSRIMQIISDKAVTLIMELTKRNKHLEKKIVERDSFIQKLQKINDAAFQNVQVSRAQKSLHHKEETRSTSALSNLIVTSSDLPTPSDIFLDVDSSGISCPVSCVKFSTCSPTSHASDASITKETSLFRNDGDSQPGIAGEDIQNVSETIPVSEMSEKKSVHISTATGAENPDCSDFEIFDNFCSTNDPEETLDDSDVKRLINSVRKLKKQRKIMLQVIADKNVGCVNYTEVAAGAELYHLTVGSELYMNVCGILLSMECFASPQVLDRSQIVPNWQCSLQWLATLLTDEYDALKVMVWKLNMMQIFECCLEAAEN
ncbi:uncharacterized protein LOC126355135 isoform X2 [Schistocerca gregaria]|uniref:uncharacterized protein LOC126355135 isoform X2 n=1 Tax=Schistocerca gregaria TaxID=7010 RepID=UPI00211DB23B|nr:uncharacterized protein LOC126355135 isoform X2 [Schistocerca gregaria]